MSIDTQEVENIRLTQKKISDTITVATELEMGYEDILSEVRKMTGYGLIEGIMLIDDHLYKLHLQGNKHATLLLVKRELLDSKHL